jgi:anaerobic selenocysteine-containing dehydrogenase
MLKIKRRDFIKGSAALMGAASLAGSSPVLNTLTKAVAAPAAGGGESPAIEWVKTVCQGCTTWCAAEAGVQEVNGVKRVVQVRGSQTFAADSGTPGAGWYHGGFVCPRGVVAIQEQYDPDRIKTPMIRTNPKKGRGEDPGFVPASWEDAIDLIADKMLELRDNNETEKFFHIRGRYTDLNSPLLYGGLNAAFGSNNYTSHSTICAEAEKFGWQHTFGRFGYMDFDVDNAEYVLLWGVDPTSSNRQVPANIVKTGDRLAAGTKYVSIDPRLNSLGAKAHHWLPVEPGTDGALALAIAHWILVSGAWYKPFVGLDDTSFVAGADAVVGTVPEKGTLGLVAWWNLELKDRTPEWAEGITGIPAAQIKQVAEEAAAAAPYVISWVGPGCTMHPTAAYAGFAAAALNGLLGSCDHEGGVFWPASTGFSPGSIDAGAASFRDAIASAGQARSAKRLDRGDTFGGPHIPLDMPGMTTSLGGARVTNAFADGINSGVRDVNGNLYSAKVVIGYWANFAFSCQGSQRWEEALKKVFYVDLGLNASETSWYADVVLPVPHHMFESWACIASHARRVAVFGMQRPAVEPMWEVRQAETEFVWMLAQSMADAGKWGGRAWDGLKNWLASPVYDEALTDPVLGTVPAAASTFTSPEQFHAAVVHKRVGQANPTVWQDFLDNGLKYGVKTFNAQGQGTRWVAAVTGSGTGFGTATGKFEFCNPANGHLKTMLNSHATAHSVSIAEVMEACNYDDTAAGIAEKGEDYAYCPHWEEPYIIGDESVYPFVLVDAKSRLNREGRSANTPWYHEFSDNDPGDVKNSDVLKMNPADVAALGLKDGQSIRITSPQTGPEGLLTRVKAWEGVAPGVVAKTYGNGHWAYGRQASSLFGRVARGANNNELIPAEWERLTASSARNACVRVKVTAV